MYPILLATVGQEKTQAGALRYAFRADEGHYRGSSESSGQRKRGPGWPIQQGKSSDRSEDREGSDATIHEKLVSGLKLRIISAGHTQ